jgi:hypothetical protein
MPTKSTLPEHEHIVLCLLKDQSRSYGACTVIRFVWVSLFQPSTDFLNTLFNTLGQMPVFKSQKDLYFFAENQRCKNKIIEYAHH